MKSELDRQRPIASVRYLSAPHYHADMQPLIPSHLVGHVTTIATDDDLTRGFALRSSAGGDRFTVSYAGTWLPEHGLIAGVDYPSLVIARAVDTDEEIVIFDLARHGYDAMFVDEHDPAVLDARRAETHVTLGGTSEFAVEIHVIDNIDWDDEEADFRDEDGEIRLITGEAISAERLRADGFDALGVTLVAADGQRFAIVEEELA